MKLVVSDKFDAAHRLYGYEGKCKFLHGHTWRVDVVIEGAVNDSTGMVMDFVELKSIVKEVLDSFDHKTLVYYMDPLIEKLDKEEVRVLSVIPTAENLSRVLYYTLLNRLNKVRLVAVRVYESDKAWAEYNG